MNESPGQSRARGFWNDMDCSNSGGNSAGTPASDAEDLSALMDRLFRAKEERRRQLARLPFEEKIRIVVELQKMAQGIPARPGQPQRKVWDIPHKK